MSRLIDIKYRIDQLDGGTFQNLCDAYLFREGYGHGYSLGMKTGTNKTATGNPDTYFISENGTYIFVMYTTQKTEFVSKAMEDLEKCFDKEKTGLNPKLVKEIVYCHTYGRLSPGEHQNLCQYCEQHQAKLTLIGLDELGNALCYTYPNLAKDFLDINVDSGQILTMQDFISEHDANKMSAPISTTFLLREEEMTEAKHLLEDHNALIISGPAGVGKTRFALQLCKELSQESGVQIICIKNRSLAIHEDLVSALSPNNNYIVFVDDANELTELHLVLDYLSPKHSSGRHIQKIIVTVRDYARQIVLKEILDVEKPAILHMDTFSDENIQTLMKSAYGITNHFYLERIVEISNGNARLAMLAGKMAVEAQSLNSISNATDLYDHYYGKQVSEINRIGINLKSALLLSCFQSMRLDNLDDLLPLLDFLDLPQAKLCQDMLKLHDAELVNMSRNRKAVKIADECFGNYLIKHILIDLKLISLSDWIETCFFINKQHTIDMCNMLMSIFADASIQDYVEQQIMLVWKRIRENKEKFWPFFKVFYPVNATETLTILYDIIEKEPPKTFSVLSLSFDKHNGEKSITDDIISILCGFKNTSQLSEAIELLLTYYHKRPDLFDQVYTALISCFGIDQNSSSQNYKVQNTIVAQLCRLFEEDPSDNTCGLLVRVSEQYLKLEFKHHEEGRKHSYNFYTVFLTFSEVLSAWRIKLIDIIYTIYTLGKFQDEIEYMLLDFGISCQNDDDQKILSEDMHRLVHFLYRLDPNNVVHCLIAAHLEQISHTFNCTYREKFAPFLSSYKYKVYDVLRVDRREQFRIGYDEYNTQHKQQVENLVKCYGINEYHRLFQICNEYLEISNKRNFTLCSGLDYAISACTKNTSLYINVIKEYLRADTPYNVDESLIIQRLFEFLSASQVKDIVETCDYTQKRTWLWTFYIEVPDHMLTVNLRDDLLAYLNVPEYNHAKGQRYRFLDKILKYKSIDSEIFLKASQIILKQDASTVNLYFALLINPVHISAESLILEFKQDIKLIENIYLKCILFSPQEDSDGSFLSVLVENDCDFLNQYLFEIFQQSKPLYHLDEHWAERIQFIWKTEKYQLYMDSIAEFLYNNLLTHTYYSYSLLRQILNTDISEPMFSQRQDAWLKSAIQQHYNNSEKIRFLFSAISESSSTRKREALELFLTLNPDYEVFSSLDLEPSHWGGSGSMIPCMQERITYLESLLPTFNGIKFLKHKMRIERMIQTWKERIDEEETRELIRSME